MPTQKAKRKSFQTQNTKPSVVGRPFGKSWHMCIMEIFPFLDYQQMFFFSIQSRAFRTCRQLSNWCCHTFIWKLDQNEAS